MTCNSEPLQITNGVVTTVSKATCVSIPEKVEYFKDGSLSAWVFYEVKDSIETIDFSKATNLIGIGSYTFFKCSKITKLDLTPCTKLSYLGIGAFRGSSVTEVKFPESPLKYLPGGCFSLCEKLQYFEIPSNIEKLNDNNPTGYGVFSQCTSIKNVTFKENSKCTTIGIKVFLESSIEKLFLPKSISSITGWSFRICYQLKVIEVDPENKYYKSINGILFSTNGTLIYYPNRATSGEIAMIPNGTIEIGDGALLGITTFTSANIPDTVKTINYRGFYGFDSLRKIVIPSSVTSIGIEAFMYCKKLTNITFENNISVIPVSCFETCESLREFRIPPGVVTVDNYAFASCKSLTKLYVPKSVKNFGSGAFKSCPSNLELIFENGSDISYFNLFLYNKEMTKIISYLGDDSKITIISSVKTIGSAAFQGKTFTQVNYENITNIDSIEDTAFSECKYLKEITIPDVQRINDYTFYRCTNLTKITLPSRITLIGKYAFSECINLKEITICEGVTKVDDCAFKSCPLLTTCKLPDSCVTIGDSSFIYCTSLITFYLPSGLNIIGKEAFAYSGISSFTNTEMVAITHLTRMAFNNCNNLTYFKFFDSVEVVNENAVSECSNLVTIEFSSSLYSINNYAISNCPLLRKIVIGDNAGLTSFTSLVFNECPSLVDIDTSGNNNFIFKDYILYNRAETEIIIFLKANNPTTIVIPSTVTKVSNYVFSDCYSINNVTFLGKGIKRIEMCAFQNCKKLQHVNFPHSIEFIGTSAFNNCNLKTINLIGSNVTSLNEGCFSSNKRLSLIILPTVLKTCAKTAFAGTNKAALVFYHGSNEITNEAGLHHTAQVFCFEDYRNKIFLGLQVQHSFKRICTIKKKQTCLATKNIIAFMVMLVTK